MNVKVTLNPTAQILKKRGLDPGGRCQQLFGDEIARRSDPYVPMKSGVLKNTRQVLKGGAEIDSSASPDTYAVAQLGIEGLNPQLNSTTTDKTYLRAGLSSTRTGVQRTFAITGDRCIGDEWQDLVFSHAMKFGVGQTVVRDYVFFNLRNGKGEKGQVSIQANSDGGGNAGSTAAIDVQLKKTGTMPVAYEYGQ